MLDYAASPVITPSKVIRELEAGNPVHLHAPGWADVSQGPCPECGVRVNKFNHLPHVRFQYSTDRAWPHRCGQPVPTGEHPRWATLEAVQREADQLRAWREYEEHMAQLGRRV